MEIREERPGDATTIAQVHREAFGDHGAVVAALVDDLRVMLDGGDGLSLVAENEDGVVGHVMFTRGWLDAPPRLVPVKILSPVAIRPVLQGHGIASALISRGLGILTAGGVPAVFLEGDPGYYGRLGFVPGKPLGFRKPSHESRTPLSR